MIKTWSLLPPAPKDFTESHPELPTLVANLLYHRNIQTQKQIDEFLEPDYTHDVHDPWLFKDMEKAVARIFQAIKTQEKIVVHGDYDADGVSASVILTDTLTNLGAKNIDTFLPHREIDGYGLNLNTIQLLAQDKTNLIITCDCGISNFSEVELANQLGVDVIITDHHTVPEKLPPAFAIVHPLVPDEPYPDKGLAGGGVAFKLAQALLKKYSENNEKLINGQNSETAEKWLLDMVAIATVGDMVPLTGESRTLTKYGLVVLNKTKRLGLQKLLLEARLTTEDGTKKYELDSETIGFQIAPRINAAGRMDHASVAYELLTATNPETAANLAYQLDQNNQERQKLTENLVKRAIDDIEKNQLNNSVLFYLGKNWSTGIVGLIAGRIKDRYYKPTIIMAENEGEITGSGRSISEFNLIGALQEMPEFFQKFGGHPMACGFSLRDTNQLENFKQTLINKFSEKTSGQTLVPTLNIDAEIDLDDVSWELYNVLEKFQPFGQANEKPRYLAKELTVVNFESVGKTGKHLRLMVKHHSNNIKKVLGWNLCETANSDNDWCKNLGKGDKIDIVFEISINEWNGNQELQLTIVDLKKSVQIS